MIKPSFRFEWNATDSLELTASALAIDVGAYDYRDEVLHETWGQNSANEVEYALRSVYRTERFSKHRIAIGGSVAQRRFHYLKPLFHDQAGPGALGYLADDASLTPVRDLFSWTEYAVFAEGVVQLTPQLSAGVGARYDGVRYEDRRIGGPGLSIDRQLAAAGHDEFVPRLALAYEIDARSSAKLTYQKGFRHPDIANLTTAAASVTETAPESMASVTLNYTRLLGSTAKLETNLYHSTLKHTIGWKTEGIDVQSGFANVPDSFSTLGGELALTYRPNENRQAHLSYSYSQPGRYAARLQRGAFGAVIEVDADRDEWVRYPRHMVKADYSHWLLNRSLLAHIAARWSSGAPDIQTSEPIATHPSFKGARLALDLSMVWKTDALLRNAEVKLDLKNVTGDHHSLPAWSGSTATGAAGVDERLYYLSFGLAF